MDYPGGTIVRRVVSRRDAASRLVPVATAILAAAIFVIDINTPEDVAVSAAYVGVVLLSARFCGALGITLVGVGCIGLTLLSVALSAEHVVTASGSMFAIAITTVLLVQGQSAQRTLGDQAKLLDLTRDPIFVRGMDHVIRYWNRGAEELYGWTKEEAVGAVSFELTQTILPDPLDEIMTELRRTGHWEGELIRKTRNGTELAVLSRWSLGRDAQGRSSTILETDTDVTERKRALEALRQAEADLARANRISTMGQLAASITHEVGQPISGVMTNANAGARWLKADPPNLDEARDAFDRIVRDVQRVVEVIGRVRALLKKGKLHTGRLDVNDAIREVIALTETEWKRAQVGVQTRLPANLPAVRADRVQVQQVILNLFLNAVEATRGIGDRTREVTIVSKTDGDDEVCVEIEDTGTGFGAENIDRLFEPFYTTKAEGTGMGLAICRGIIEAHHGRLWATPNRPHGAVFRFTLPRAAAVPEGSESLAS